MGGRAAAGSPAGPGRRHLLANLWGCAVKKQLCLGPLRAEHHAAAAASTAAARAEGGPAVDVHRLVQALHEQGVRTPVCLRFLDIVGDRIARLNVSARGRSGRRWVQGRAHEGRGSGAAGGLEAGRAGAGRASHSRCAGTP